MRANLKKARQDAGLTQKAVAEYLGVTERHYQYIENGARLGKIEYWDKLEDLFNIQQRELREIHGKEDTRGTLQKNQQAQ